MLLPLAGAYCAALALFLGLRLVMADSWWWVALLDNFVLYLFGPLLLVLPLAGLLRQRWLGRRLADAWVFNISRLDVPNLPCPITGTEP